MAEGPRALEQRAEERYRAVDCASAIALYEEAYRDYRDYRDAGNRLGAGRAARIVAWLRGHVHGDWAVSGGWLAQARTLLEGAGDDPIEQEALCRAAWDLGRRHGDVLPVPAFFAPEHVAGILQAAA